MAAEYLDIELDLQHAEVDAMLRRERMIRDRTNPFIVYDDFDFLDRFRLTKAGVLQLMRLVGNQIDEGKRQIDVPPMLQVLVTLRFFATGSYLRLVGDSVGIHITTVSNIIKRVSRSIARHRARYVNYPDERERLSTQEKFYELCQLPGIVGAIDCTHVPIISPGGENAESFRNRKGFFSVNVQGVCNTELYFTNIVARWPGSSHDSRIFDNSAIGADFATGVIDGVLLGDNGYGLKPYLLTPVLKPTTAQERRFNAHLSRGRVKIENAFGVLKRRFPCLALDLRLKLNTSLVVIIACVVLHNFSKALVEPLPNEVALPNRRQEVHALPIDRIEGGRALRNFLIRRF